MPCRNPRALPLTNSLPPDNFERPPARARRCLREGAAVVEFALLLPFIFLLLAGILEMGRLMEAQQTLSNAAREGARHAIRVDAGTADVQQVVDDYLKGAGVSGHTVKVETPAGTGGSDLIAVSVSVPYTNVSLLPAHTLQWLENKTLIASTTLRKEKALTQGTASGSPG